MTYRRSVPYITLYTSEKKKKKKLKHPSLMLSVTHFAVLVKYKKITKFTSIYLVLAYKQYHYKCSVHVLYISALQVKALMNQSTFLSQLMWR